MVALPFVTLEGMKMTKRHNGVLRHTSRIGRALAAVLSVATIVVSLVLAPWSSRPQAKTVVAHSAISAIPHYDPPLSAEMYLAHQQFKMVEPATTPFDTRRAHAAHVAHVAHEEYLASLRAAATAAKAAPTFTPRPAPATPTFTPAPAPAPVPQSSGRLSGTLGCVDLEHLWDAAGGNPAEAFMAAEIAMAESGGNQYAHSPTNDFGYWQINGSHGPGEATFDPMGNARAAILISSDGTNWSPWTTYTSGAYQGKC